MKPIFEQPYSVDSTFGDGCHYSIMETIIPTTIDCSQDPDLLYDKLNALLINKFRFAIIWDKDHDERVLSVLEGLYAVDLLKHIVIIGEHKGHLTVLVSKHIENNVKQDIINVIDCLVSTFVLPDKWTSLVYSDLPDDMYTGITQDDNIIDSKRFIQLIISTWKL